MTDRATAWSVTINNPTESDDVNLMAARAKKGWTVIGQKEVGEKGTPHYQLLVKTPQARASQLKKAFPRAHIEIAKNVKALSSYVVKEETRVGELPTSMYFPNLQEFWELCAGLANREVVDNITGTYEDDMLKELDIITSKLIRRGYHVETLAVNPQIRSAWKKFGFDILERCSLQKDRQTDKKKDELIIPTVIYNETTDPIKQDCELHEAKSISGFNNNEEDEEGFQECETYEGSEDGCEEDD